MTYFLNTSPFCNDSCIYCKQLEKKNPAFKTLDEIERELKKAKKQGFNLVRLSCNTDRRKDFLEILQLIKKYNFQIILETNGRMFSHVDFLKRADEYIDRYEVYFNDRHKEFTAGVANILKISKNKKFLTAKIVVLEPNLPFLLPIIDGIKKLGIRRVKFLVPFRLQYDCTLPLADIVFPVHVAQNYAKDKGIEILNDQELENHPYLPKDLGYFNLDKARLELNFKKHKNRPKFSIVIPTFNKKISLKPVLGSFFRQNYPKSKYEIIVIDDGSSDGTAKMIKEINPTCNFKYFYWPREKMALKDNFKKWAKFYNRVGLARNIGINHAEGEIILFNDADVMAAKDCLKRHEKYHRKHQNIIVRGFRMSLPKGFNAGDKKIKDFGFLDKVSKPEKTKRGEELCCRMHNNLLRSGWHRIVTANLSVRRNYLEQAGGFSGDFVFWGSEDTDLGYRLAKLKMKFMWDAEIKVYHLYHPRESGGDLNHLLVSWLNINILYRKYLDIKLYNLLLEGVSRRLDDLILD